MDDTLKSRLKGIAGEDIRFDSPMDRYTTFRVGGRAEALYAASEVTRLQEIVACLNREDVPYVVVGKGSNLLVRNGGIKGVVIRLQGGLAAIEKDRTDARAITAGGGASLSALLSRCTRDGLGGLEFLAGIPGTAGGAVAMNAGAWGKDIGGAVDHVQVVNRKGELDALTRSRLRFRYRGSDIPEGAVIVKVRFELNPEEGGVVAGRLADHLKRRRETQPLDLPSAGSIFKNPPNDFAGRLIEEAGLKGTQIGGAMISPRHANFIVNTGGAKAEDILALMDLARTRVRERTGIELEPEIRVIG